MFPDRLQRGNEGGAYPGDSLSGEAQELQTCGSYHCDYSSSSSSTCGMFHCYQ